LFNAYKDKQQIVNPLVQDGMKLIPSVTRVFAQSKELYVYLQAYEPGVETARPLAAYVTFYRAGAKVFETAPLRTVDTTAARLKTLPLQFRFPLGALAPGEYECQVTVLDAAEKKAAFWQAPVMVVR
jgi:hypothetical protein